jgi:hypothetical protein
VAGIGARFTSGASGGLVNLRSLSGDPETAQRIRDVARSHQLRRSVAELLRAAFDDPAHVLTAKRQAAAITEAGQHPRALEGSNSRCGRAPGSR